MTNDDRHLLEAYATSGTEAAFAELVRRHFNLVWSAAHRITGDADLARDVAQTVFTDLARKARHLRADTVLPGWLHRAACLAAHKVNRSNHRRTRREREAMELVESNRSPGEPAAGAEPVLAQLDDALDTLNRADRDAVLLRYFSKRSLGEVGQTLGVNEEAARKRVNRAVEKLRAWFARRGVETAGTTVIAALGLAGSQAAPAGLAGTVAAASFAGMGTLGLYETILLMKSKLAMGLVAVAAVATPLTYQQIAVQRLRVENARLEAVQQQARTEAAAAAARAAGTTADKAELEQLRAEHLELLRLRGEVGLLRAELARARAAEKTVRAAQAGLAAANAAVAEQADAAKATAEQQERLVAIKKLNVMKRWALAMHLYAADHQDQFPADFAAMRELFNSSAAGNPGDDEAPVLSEDQIEITFRGKLTEIAEPARTIVLKEKETRAMGGRLSRAYAFADGHSEIHAAPDGNFTEWERARGVNP